MIGREGRLWRDDEKHKEFTPLLDDSEDDDYLDEIIIESSSDSDDCGEELLSSDDYHEYDDTLQEVIVDGGVKISSPKRDGSVRSLYENINDCIEILEQARAKIPDAVKKARTQKYLYAAVALSGITLAVASPFTFLGLLVNHWDEVYNALLPVWKQKLNDLHASLNETQVSFDEVNALYEHTLGGLIGDDIDEWFNRMNGSRDVCLEYLPLGAHGVATVSGTCAEFVATREFDSWDAQTQSYEYVQAGISSGTLCGYNWFTGYSDCIALIDDMKRHEYLPKHNEIYATFCHLAAAQDHPIDFCNDLASSACEEITNFTQSAADFNATSALRDNLMNQYSHVKHNITNVEGLIASHYGKDVVSTWQPIMLSLGFGASIAAISGLLLWQGIQNRKYESAVAHTRDIDVCLTDPKHVGKIMYVAARLGINMNDGGGVLTVDDLIDMLKEEVQAIEDRWRYRVAFLCAKYDPASNPYRLFHCGPKDPIKMILDYAELKPQLTLKQ